ncbi:MAG: AAA family ATPase [Caulobacteraceae bacterium]
MPTISFISSKGGVGKTTSAIVLATQLAKVNTVEIIDADPNRPISDWEQLAPMKNIRVNCDVTQETLVEAIDEAAHRAAFVIVDCEGTASLSVAYAVRLSDLVLIPCKGSQLDAKQAVRSIKLIRDEGRGRKPIPHAILFTMTNPAIRTKGLDYMQAEYAEAGVTMLKCHLHDREAFRALFSFGGSLDMLTKANVSNSSKAIENAEEFAAEVLGMLTKSMETA